MSVVLGHAGPSYFSDSGEIPLSNDKLSMFLNFMWTVRVGAPNSGCSFMTPEEHGSKARRRVCWTLQRSQ